MCASSASSDTEDDMTQRSGKVVRAPATTVVPALTASAGYSAVSAAQVAVHAAQSLATSRWFYLPTSITPALHSRLPLLCIAPVSSLPPYSETRFTEQSMSSASCRISCRMRAGRRMLMAGFGRNLDPCLGEILSGAHPTHTPAQWPRPMSRRRRSASAIRKRYASVAGRSHWRHIRLTSAATS